MPAKGNTRDSSETWKAIPGFEGYEVSDYGQVRSYRRQGGGQFHLTPHLLKPATRQQGGYRGVNLQHDRQSHFTGVARLVLLTFIGPCPNGMEACHNNSNPSDDRLENLRYDTALGNTRDRLNLSDVQVIEMRERRAQGESIASLARLFNTKYRTAVDICCGKTYRWIGGPFSTGQRRWSKLSTNSIIAMRTERANSNVTLKDIGKKYGVGESYVSRICSGEYYSDSGGPITVGKIAGGKEAE